MIPHAQFLPFYLPLSFYSTLSLIFGILTYHYLSCALFLMCISIVFLFFITLTQLKKYPLNHFLIVFLYGSFFLGILNLWYHNQWQKQTIPFTTQHATGTIVDYIKTGNPLWPHRLTVLITKTTTGVIVSNIQCPIFIYTKNSPTVFIDDHIIINNCTIKQPAQNNFSLYLRKEGVLSTLFIPFFKPDITRNSHYSIKKNLFKLQNFINESARSSLSPITYALFCSLFLGDKGSGKSTLENHSHHFQEWGIAHQLAKSGFHLIIFIMVWTLFFSFIPFNFKIKHSLIILLCSCYYLLTPHSISFSRSFYLFLGSRLLQIFEWQAHTINILSLICYATLLLNPYTLFGLDFQLSFYLTFCLSWIAQLDRQKRILI